MGLFYRRPLCLFCALFMLTALIFGYLSTDIGKIIIIVLATAILICSVLLFCIRKYKSVFLFCILCICAVGLALLLGTFRMEYRESRAEQYIGKRNVEMSVTDVSYCSEYTSVYTVKLENISGNKTNIKAQLVCAFSSDLDVGDTIQAPLELKSVFSTALGMTAEQRYADRDTMLLAVLYDSDNVYIKRFDDTVPFWRMLFEKNGIRVLIDKSQDFVCERLDKLLGDNVSGLAKGFLLGDRSDISTEEIRDFRRTGLSHIFAVSGMHITVLLGSLDYILKRLYVHRYIRMSAIAILALPLLAMTGFALSAWRSVIMLWIAYTYFAVSEDADIPTSLFISITLIIAVSPYAIYDMGMWLSFLATLGLVCVYPWIKSKIPYPSKSRYRGVLKILRAVLLIIIMTLVCNIFVLPLQWYIFGEMSLVSYAANVMMSPLSMAFMISALMCVILGAVPLLGPICIFVTKLLCTVIRESVGTLSRSDMATVSLRYPFAAILIILFTVAFTILLIIELKRKWLICIPVVSFAAAFAVCILVYNIIKPQRLTYYKDGTQELITVSSCEKLAIIDISNGAYFRFAEIMSDASEYGTVCVDKIVFTDITKIHISSMDYFLRSNIVNTIYIPTPQNDEQRLNSLLMAALAEECGTQAYLYNSSEVTYLDGIELAVDISYIESSPFISIFAASEGKLLGYADANLFDKNGNARLASIFQKCDTLLVSGNNLPSNTYTPCVPREKTVVYMSNDLYRLSGRVGTAYCNTKENTVLIFSLK